MKIQQDIRVGLDSLKLEQKVAYNQRNSFQSMIEKQGSRLKTEELGRLLKDIDVAGQRLARSRQFQDLAKFKTLVKRFVKEAVDFGFNLKQSKSWSGYGENRTLRLIETIDEKLISLTEELRLGEKDSLNLLEQIGEIKGLLINLYT
ncbi:YaaR family protein [Bacillus litorisediminis]|uniref:YaaR family protein n=1 Tax=Bacillus litorisediminis TaxID=2922713 RepID=UPI001FAEE15D|nr:YaaR family protein [Bacillus litorisediminis]